MNSGNLFVLVTAIMTIIGVLVAYMSTNTYKLTYNGVLVVLILVGLFNSLAMRMIKLRGAPESVLTAGIGSLLIALVGAILTLVILASRFGFAQGLGLGIIAGLASSIINYFIKTL